MFLYFYPDSSLHVLQGDRLEFISIQIVNLTIGNTVINLLFLYPKPKIQHWANGFIGHRVLLKASDMGWDRSSFYFSLFLLHQPLQDYK